MNLFVFLTAISSIPLVFTINCAIRYHIWRPFFGEFSAFDYVAATDTLGRKSYIGKVIPVTGTRSWTQPTQIMFDYTQFAWEDGVVRRQDRFLEILMVETIHRNKFRWVSVHSTTDLREIQQRHCMVEGGIFEHNHETFVTYIGRTQANGSFSIGPVYLHRWSRLAGMHYIFNDVVKYKYSHYQVLIFEDANHDDSDSDPYDRRRSKNLRPKKN